MTLFLCRRCDSVLINKNLSQPSDFTWLMFSRFELHPVGLKSELCMFVCGRVAPSSVTQYYRARPCANIIWAGKLKVEMRKVFTLIFGKSIFDWQKLTKWLTVWLIALQFHANWQDVQISRKHNQPNLSVTDSLGFRLTDFRLYHWLSERNFGSRNWDCCTVILFNPTSAILTLSFPWEHEQLFRYNQLEKFVKKTDDLRKKLEVLLWRKGNNNALIPNYFRPTFFRLHLTTLNHKLVMAGNLLCGRFK